ncbi:MAG: hypothetical protein JRN07_04000, partial [Nitrososphaerota archaeon]|nr:hypothetical protein [Nitrososphaerota archaeon]
DLASISSSVTASIAPPDSLAAALAPAQEAGFPIRMAVAMVSQSAVNIVPKSLYYPINSIAAFMAQTLDSAFTDPTSMEVYALVELAVVLFAITTIINVLARLLVRQGFITSAEHVVQV